MSLPPPSYDEVGLTSVAEPHHFYAAPAAPATTLLYSKAKFLKRTKVEIHVETTVSCLYDSVRFTVYFLNI
jgi:hypothetical protein